jgi:DNA sulfur modification protein DndE
MLPNKVKISVVASESAKILKQRTGLTPNIICRIALLCSMERGVLEKKVGGEQFDLEFNSSTLFGDTALLMEVMLGELYGKLDGKNIAEIISSHIEDGLIDLRKSKNILEFVEYSNLI